MTQNNQKKTPKPLNSYARYTGIAFQMIAIMLMAGFGGIKLDEWLQTSPIFTVVLLLLAVVIAMVNVIREFT